MKNLNFIGLLLFIIVIVISIASYTNKNTYIVKITDKQSISTEDGHKYLVYTNSGTFENTDSFFYLKFNSSDIQGKIEIDHIYKIKTYGFRIGLLSSYENIVSVSKIE